MIKAVIFDVDGVLIDSLNANVKFYQDLLVYVGYKSPPRSEIFKLLHLPMMDVIKILTKLTSEKEIRRIWELGKSRSVSYPYDLVSTPKDLEQTIKDLNKKYALGIVTSRIRGGVFTVPQLAHLKQYFKVAIYYEDTKKHKPNPDPLLLAAEKLKIKPENIVYIGDMESDIQSAKASHMKMILFNKVNLFKAQYCTDSFNSLPKLISSLHPNM